MSRPHILVAWELGANFGHASKIAEMARGLGGRARLTVAARQPWAIRAMAPDLVADLMAAPHAAPRRRGSGDPGISYPDDLRHCGWDNVGELAALVEAWQTLIRLTRPDILVAQAAPTALLAARGLGVPTAMVGSGYDAPARARPMPPFFFWKPERVAEAGAREAKVLAVANAVLARGGRPGVEWFAEVLAADLYALATVAELDHYAPRDRIEPGHPPYLGQLVTLDAGAVVEWQPGERRRVVAYLRPGGAGFDAVVGALAGLDGGWDVVLAAPGVGQAVRDRLAAAPVRIVDGPVRLDRLLARCDLGLSHASNGVAAAFLTHGVPQIGLPTQAEQAMLVRVLGRQGLALGLIGTYGAAEVRAVIDRALAGAAMARAAAARIGRGQPGPAIAEALLALA